MGIFTAAGIIEERRSLPDETRDLVRESLVWFNAHLKVPRLDETEWRCLFWFDSGAQSFVGRLWELVYLLEDEGVFVSIVRTDRPGMIVYRDEHQIAAVPPKRDANRARRIRN